MKKMILILDDEEALTELISQELRKHGYGTYGLVSKLEGYNWSKINKPDLIISDIKSPQMEGFKFLHKIRSNMKTKNIPVIIVSSTCSEPEDVDRALSLGANECFTKPIEIEDLLKSIERFIG